MYVYTLDSNIFTVTLYGYILPPVVVFTIFTNTLTCIVLLKKHMRSTTNIILLSIALLDMFTGISILPVCIYYFTLGYYKEYVPYPFCRITELGRHAIPITIHTASIWITVVLVVQRYICVCHPQVAKRCCTIPITISCIIITCTLALLMNIVYFIYFEYTAIEISSRLDVSKNITGCSRRPSALTRDYNLRMYQMWFEAIFVRFIPCFTLLMLNSVLIRTIRRAAKRRRMLLSQNRTPESRNLSESNRTTMLLVMVVGLFLMVELPLGAVYVTGIIEHTCNVSISWTTYYMVSIFTPFLMYLFFPLNIFIYCCMNRQFRETFKSLFK